MTTTAQFLTITGGNITQCVNQTTSWDLFNIGFFTQAVTTADVVLSAADSLNNIVVVTGATAQAHSLTISRAPDDGTAVFILNQSALTVLTVQFSSGTGITLLPYESGLVIGDGTNATLFYMAQ